MFKKYMIFIISILLVLPFITNSASAVTYPNLVESKPEDNDQHVPLGTDIYFEFNEDILEYDINKIKLLRKLSNNNYKEEKIKQVKVSDEVLTVIPENKLLFNKDYKLEIESYSIELSNGLYSRKITHDFKTNYMTFYEVMAVESGEISKLFANYSPRQLIVTAPERYVDKIAVNHKKQGAFKDQVTTDVTDTLTSIDIFVNSKDVEKVKVEIYEENTRIATKYAKRYEYSSNRQEYNIGFGNLPVNFDVKVTVLDKNLEIKDKKFVKVVSEDQLITNVIEDYKYKTAGESNSLAELMADPKLFNTYLNEHNMNDIRVQVDK
ncbi:Ig-like domain-containing protein [Bacillus sp. SCS-151]|uniref:Ig-like domain-containing protein n=1 Tax=Nanhaiella sioensis TaxID=3115293 RepID=UPI00397DA664